MIEMLKRIRKIFTNENYRRLVWHGFELGKYTIIYGSILGLTALGITVWLFGTMNLFSLVWQSIGEWGSSSGAATQAMQQLETNAIRLLDIFLLSVVLFIVAIGLYSIFVKEKSIKLPLEVKGIGELERYLFGTIVTILVIAALDKILYLEKKDTTLSGNAIIIIMIFVVILAISIYLAIQKEHEKHEKDKQPINGKK